MALYSEYTSTYADGYEAIMKMTTLYNDGMFWEKNQNETTHIVDFIEDLITYKNRRYHHSFFATVCL